MSATIPNISDISKWLNATEYSCDFRPVPLVETIKIGNQIFTSKGDLIRKIHKIYPTDPDDIFQLCEEVIF